MRANVLLRWLVPGLLIGVVFVIVKGWISDEKSAATAKDDSQEKLELSPEEAKDLGIAGDTPRDTVATLVGQVKAMRSEMLSLKKSNETLQKDNNRLRQREQNVDSRINSALSSVTQQADKDRQVAESTRAASEQERKQTRTLLDQVESRLAKLKGEDLPVGFGLEPGDGKRFSKQPNNPDLLTWIEPEGNTSKPESGTDTTDTSPKVFQKLDSLSSDALDRSQKTLERDSPASGRSVERTQDAHPVYTIAQNSTLTGSVAMTALIGRVPVDGTVNDPFPFKILIGPENLAANGIDLPDIEGAVMSGTASGDWTLSCVRGQVESITFVFAGGTVRTVPEPDAPSRGKSNTTQSSDLDKVRGGLGYLSDPYGIPCIGGERRSNAQQYLGTQSLITAAGAGVAALLGNDQSSTSVVGAGGSVGITSQSAGNTALNTILSSGVSDITDWSKSLYGEAFAAVYVQPAAKVAVHLDQEIAIDYEPNGRRVRHEHNSEHSLDLD
ncbi:TIGR03752 family integrating conjugative element protein [Pseudomonas sp. LRF_L74]|uniref:TIGR03752 family integrating conjugative element protein n=1 Tax=Pseudomonas sp. LRF_L74 TaxID=3369422 RepID=UPI003F643B7E